MRLLALVSVVSSLSLAAAAEEREWGIVDHSPDQTLSAGQILSLYCRVGGDGVAGNDDWKTCRWQRATDGASCLVTYVCDGTFCVTGGGEWSHRIECDAALTRADFFGDDPEDRNWLCGINVPDITAEHSSEWSCIIEQCKVNACYQENGNENFVEQKINIVVNE
jgi:hypothetical protein